MFELVEMLSNPMKYRAEWRDGELYVKERESKPDLPPAGPKPDARKRRGPQPLKKAA